MNNENDKLRKTAEKILREKGSKSYVEYSNDLENLVQELNIYQIELEQQNLELRKTQEELEKAHSKYTDLYENAPTGYVTIDKNDVIIGLEILV